MKVNGFIRRGVAHLLSVLMILSTLSMGLTAMGVAGPQEAYAAGIEAITAGETVNLGGYSAPDGYYNFGAPGQWTALAVEDSKVLVTAKDVWAGYDEDSGEVLGITYTDQNTWMDKFYTDFLKEDAHIASSGDHPVFALSKDQANSLFADNDARAATNSWWLATAIGTNNAYMVNADGSVGFKQNTTEICVRPSFYIDLETVVCSKKLAGAWNMYDSHSFGKWTKKDDEKHQRTCSRDGAVEEAAHTWDEGVVADGVKTYTCADCGATKTEEVASDLPEIVVAIDSANEQPATGGSYRWAFFGADGDIDLNDLSADDFSMQVKVGDGEWTAATDVTVELKASDDCDGIVEAAVPDNTEEVAKQWRFTYAGGILDWGYSEADCPAITQAAAELQVVKPSNVYMFRGEGVDEFQPASGGTFAWDAVNADYTLYDPMAELVTAEDFKLQTKKVTEPDTAWADVEGAALSLTETDEEDTVKITATIADNEDDYDKHWRVVYKHSAVDLQIESCSSIQITQMKPEAAAEPEITKIEYDKTEYSDDVTVTASLTGTGLDALTAEDFKLEFDGEGWGDYMAYNYGNIAVNPAADGNSAEVTFNLSKGNKAYRFTVQNYVAGSVTNNPQVFKFKEPPAKAYTKAEFNATEFTSEGGTLTVSLTGENLNLATAADFKLYVPDTEYGGDMDSNIRADYAAADDGLSGTATFTLPANTGEEDVEYTFNIVKKIQYGMPFFYTADEVTGAKTKIKVKAPAAAPAEKPVIGDVYILSGNTQPAAGGTYSWAFYGIDDTVDWSGVTSADFSAQVKAGDGEWSASDATVTLSSNDEYDGVVTISVPDNDQEVEKQWRFTYAGGIVDYDDNPADCPAIKQAAAEPAPAEKPALVISADDESVSADGGEISWFVQSYDGSDLEGAVTSADFTVQMNAGDGWVGKDDVSATFEIGNNDDEGEVKVNVPSNNEEKEKSWRLVYSGDLYAHEGEALKPADCPAITQAAKDPVAEAKTTAKAELAAYRDAKDNAEYDDEGVATLNAAKEAGDSAIEAAATTDAVATALENVVAVFHQDRRYLKYSHIWTAHCTRISLTFYLYDGIHHRSPVKLFFFARNISPRRDWSHNHY